MATSQTNEVQLTLTDERKLPFLKELLAEFGYRETQPFVFVEYRGRTLSQRAALSKLRKRPSRQLWGNR